MMIPGDSLNPETRKRLRAIVFLLFALSGIAGLAYQVVWVRMLSSVFGVTAFAISTVLASFMAGLALGSYVFGRWIDRFPRPLLAYALLEIGIGFYALLVPSLLGLTGGALHAAYGSLEGSPALQILLRAVLAFLVLVIPTTFMGATLPILCKYFIETLDRVGRETGRLYFINTIGAVLGCAVAGFVLIPNHGLWRTTLIGAVINIGVGVIALTLDRVGASAATVPMVASPSDATPVASRRKTFGQRWILIAFALSGFCALVFEVIWSRILILVFGSTVYSFSAMLTVFLLGLALGGVVVGRIADRSRQPLRLLAWVLALISLVLVLETASVNHLPHIFLRLLFDGGMSFSSLTLVKLLLSFMILFPAAFLFGGTFPIVSRLYTDSLARTGQSIGTVYAMNTLGAILGSILGGFVFLPLFGMRASLLVIAGLLIVTAAVSMVVPFERSRPRLATALILLSTFAVSMFVLPDWNRSLLALGVYFDPLSFVDPEGRDILDQVLAENDNLYYAEGLNDTIIVNESPSHRSLTINGKTIATSAWQDILHLKMLGHLPVLLHPGQPKVVINVGLGIGGTVSGLASHSSVDRVDAAELERKVVDGTRLFGESNDHILDNEKLNLIFGDGRNHLGMTREFYDIISSDPFHPYMTGAGNLYSLEYLQTAKKRLNSDGVMTQWIPLHQLGVAEMHSLVATFGTVFPHFTLWFSGQSVILIGSDHRLELDHGLLTAKLHEPGAAEWLERLGMATPETLMPFLMGDEVSLAGYMEGARLNTDDHPWVEYSAARLLYENTVGANLEELLRYTLSPESVLAYLGASSEAQLPREEALARIEAKRNGISGIVDMLAGDLDFAVDKLSRSMTSAPDPFMANWLADTHKYAGKFAQEAGNFELAIAHYRATLRLRPENGTALANLGHLYYHGGDYVAARGLLETAHQQHPANAEIMLRLGMVYDGLGLVDLANRMFDAAYERDPTSPSVLTLLAANRLKRRDYPAAERFFRESLKFDPANIEARALLSQSVLFQGRVDEARAECEKILSQEPDASTGRLCSGTIHMQQGDPLSAEGEFSRAVGLGDADGEANFRLARALAAQGKTEPAREALGRALEIGGPFFGERALRDPLLYGFVAPPAGAVPADS